MIWKNKKIITILFATFVTTILILSSLLSSEKTTDNQLVADAKRRDFSIELNIIGVLDAAKSHMISSDLEGSNGTIIYLIDDGKRVKKDDLLVKFDQATFEKEVDNLEAQVESYSAAVQAAEQIVAFEENQVKREIANAQYGHNIAALYLKVRWLNIYLIDDRGGR